MGDEGKNVKILDINDWIDDYSTFMADEALKLIDAQGNKRGPEVKRALIIHFMARVLTSTVFTVLHERPEKVKDKKERLDFNKKNYAEFKEQICEMIGMSFSTALSHYSGKSIEYYCVIKPIPDPLSKAVN